MAMTDLLPGDRQANPVRLPHHVRAAITAELTMLFDRAEILLARLDRADGDCDLEDDDPAGDPLDERGEASDDEARGTLPTRPFYAVDQATGPTNYSAAQATYLAEENGLTRSSNGGWRRAA